MRVDPDDLAADVAELHQHWAAAQERVRSLELLFRAAQDVVGDLGSAYRQMRDLSDLVRRLPSLDQQALEHQRFLDELPL